MYIELCISKYEGGNNAKLYLTKSYLAFSTLPTLLITAGLAPAILVKIASSVPIPLNINIVVQLLLFLLVISKNEINIANLLKNGPQRINFKKV